MGKNYCGILAVLIMIGLIIAISGCTSSNSSSKTNTTTPPVTLSNFTAKGVTFEYMSKYMTCKEGEGNTIANLNYTTVGATGYVKKWPGMSLESLKSDILSETFQDHNITETSSIGRDLNYKGYRISAKANSPYNLTEDYVIFATGENAYEITISGNTGSSLSYILSPIEGSIYVT